jgi:hypothetical protein
MRYVRRPSGAYSSAPTLKREHHTDRCSIVVLSWPTSSTLKYSGEEYLSGTTGERSILL